MEGQLVLKRQIMASGSAKYDTHDEGRQKCSRIFGSPTDSDTSCTSPHERLRCKCRSALRYGADVTRCRIKEHQSSVTSTREGCCIISGGGGGLVRDPFSRGPGRRGDFVLVARLFSLRQVNTDMHAVSLAPFGDGLACGPRFLRRR